MPRFVDATGYLGQLAFSTQLSWFHMICDLAIAGHSGVPTALELDTLQKIFAQRASYYRQVGTSAIAPPVPVVRSFDGLESLGGFLNFKLIGNALTLTFPKRITIVFGTNGSGKSSLCEALKLLASPNRPVRPLGNARSSTKGFPGFQYKFGSDTTAQSWSEAQGFGVRQSLVKYFDTDIAIKKVKDPVSPDAVILLAPFRLNVFETAQVLTNALREAFQRADQTNSSQLAEGLVQIRTVFAAFVPRPLNSLSNIDSSLLLSQIELGRNFTSEEELKSKRTAISELEKTNSEEGMKLLRAEQRELTEFVAALDTLIKEADAFVAIGSEKKSMDLVTKQAAQTELAKALIPEGESLDSLQALLRAAEPLCNFEEAAHESCPLCRRTLGDREVHLFAQYHALLQGNLERELTVLKGDLKKAATIIERIRGMNVSKWAGWQTVSREVLSVATTQAATLVAEIDLPKAWTQVAGAALQRLGELSVAAKESLAQKTKAIETAAKGRIEVTKQIVEQKKQMEPLEYAKQISDNLGLLERVGKLMKRSEFWKSRGTEFTPILKKITTTAKQAHDDLVVADFEEKLNAEYIALTEKPMSAFGVKLARRGADAAVKMVPQIGGKDIDGILSEGEQRAHALALFYAELGTCMQSVIVFDDPVSSFDYNFIANYCTRLRDFVLEKGDRQAIVLTHNWEFFIQLQSTLHTAGLDNQVSVQVLENCTSVAEYSERTVDLKKNIVAALSISGEPTETQKEMLAGNMRRLVEAVVNTHVFNDQRHQYKQKSNNVSDFRYFTKLVPLEPKEAMTFRDLYAKLSVAEHDDPRNAFVNTDKATFHARYDQILAIEAAIVSRKPSLA